MHTPYNDAAIDALYNGLFCDEPQSPLAQDGQPLAAWQRALSGGPAFAGALRRLAEDSSNESRVRALACRQLQRHGHAVPVRELLGVVVEVPLDSGLDTLAAFADGSVRFLHGSGRMTLTDGAVPALQPQVQALLAASRTVVARIGPTDQPRRPAPQSHVRLSFIVSDGLYFGEGPMDVLMNDGMAGPLLRHAVALLDEVTGLVAA